MYGWRTACVGLVGFGLLSLANGETRPYSPSFENPILSEWAWDRHTIDHNADITSIYSAGNGDLWIGVRDGIIRRTNDSYRYFNEGDGFGSGETYQILETHEGRIYGFNSGYVLYLNGDQWEDIPLHQDTQGQANFGFIDINDSLIVAHADRILVITPEGERKDYHPGIIINSITQDSDGYYWFSCNNEGNIYRVKEAASFNNPDEWELIYGSETLSDREFLLYDKNGLIWFVDYTSSRPPMSYSLNTQQWKEHHLDEIGGSNSNTAIRQTKDGTIWILARGKIHCYRDDKWEVYDYTQCPVPANFPLMTESTEGDVIIAESGRQIFRIDYQGNRWRSILNLHFQAEDKNGNKWYLSHDGSIISSDTNGQNWVLHEPPYGRMEHPMLMATTTNGGVWCAGSHLGNATVDLYLDGSWRRFGTSGFAMGFSHQSFFESEDGTVYLGAGQEHQVNSQNTGGLMVFRPSSDGYSVGYQTPPSLPFRVVGIVQYPKGGDLWLGGHSLVRYNFSSVETVTNDLGLTASWIDSVHATSDALYVCVWGKGGFRLDEEGWQLYNSENGGLPNNVSQFLCNDKMVVAATNDGLLRLDGQKWFPFISESILMPRESGYLKMDTTGGVWINKSPIEWFYRGLVTEKTTDPVLSDFRTILWKPDRMAPDTVSITPNRSQFVDSSVRLEWMGADLWSGLKTGGMSYSYRINGGDWTDFQMDNYLVLTDLKPGWHTVEVRSRNSSFMIDPTPLILMFENVVPVYRAWWFTPLIVLLVCSTVAAIILVVRMRVKFLFEIDEMKLRYFTNISHELRTPLTLILGPIESALQNTKSEANSKALSLAYRHAIRLRDLVDQLLEFRKLENGKISSNLQETPFPEYLENILSAFEGAIVQKHQRMIFRTQVDGLVCQIDQDQYQKVVYNLVSNAIKFTDAGGQIEVCVEWKQSAAGKHGQLLTRVYNDGPAIPSEDIERIFDPYFQARKGSVQNLQKSTGIGLALSKQLVESQDGSIVLVSPVEDGRGCRFEVTIPVEYSSSGSINTPPRKMEIGFGLHARLFEGIEDSIKEQVEAQSVDSESPLVLVVEDNADIRSFISDQFRGTYRTIEAADGKTALRMAQSHIPDIIISDVMMPGLNGYDLCREIKRNPETNHIPFIMLTALQSGENEIAGMGCGADDYLKKPISPVLLRLKIRNALEARIRARERFLMEFKIEPPPDTPKDHSREFIDLARGFVEQHLDDASFGVNELADELKMSRSVAYRKFKAVINDSPAAFIRMIRLKRASELLLNGDRSVLEVALDVGFSDASAFSRTFKEHFKISPSEYRTRN